MIKTIYADCKTVLALGKQGENNAVRVIFKLAAWREMYGNGSVALLIQRKGDPAPYAAPVTIDGDTAVWTVSNTDNAVAGYGNAELQYFVGNVLAKSATWRIYTEKALGDATEDVPEPWQTYTEQVLAAGQEAEAARQEWASMTANAETLDPDEAATASYSDGVLSLGIPRGERGEKGDAGALASVTATVDGTTGTPSVTVTYDGENAAFAFVGLKGERGERGERGEQGIQGLQGERGQQGLQGIQGLQGVRGERGETGATGQPGADGHSPAVTAQKSGTTTTIKVDGVSIATISDGAPGQQGTPGTPGRDGSPGTPGQDGEDGFSPIISTATISGGHRVTITDASGTNSFDVMDGSSNWGDISGKPFESIGDGLSVADGVLSASGGGGGSGDWRLIKKLTLTEQADRVDINTDEAGNAFSVHHVFILTSTRAYDENPAQFALLVNGKWGTGDPYLNSGFKPTKSSESGFTKEAFEAVAADGCANVFEHWKPYILNGNHLGNDITVNNQYFDSITSVSFANGKFDAGSTFTILGR